jgi:hypothetical protein
VKDILVREPQNVVALCGNRGLLSCIVSNLLVCPMSRPIDLDDHSRLEAREVGNEPTENNLATESDACDLLAPEALP